ncbi:MAG: outer membrane lipoprotein carrier protein LolA [Bacteroidota bacterium]|nr:outer membrane lipoprotein carrier protein LolA [Bacteroidota bacterium]
MKKIILVSLIFFINVNAFAQDDKYIHDPKAKVVLDKVSEKLKNHKTARFYFRYTLYNVQDSSKSEYQGFLFVKGEKKYKILIPGQEMFSNGVKTFTFNKSANEMNITFVDPSADAVYTPQNMLNMYKKGYKYQYKGDLTFAAAVRKDGKIATKNKTCAVIDLYPEKIKKSTFAIIRLWIDKSTNELVSAKFQQKNGIEQVVEILTTDFDITINDKIFIFDKTLYPKNIDVIDFTE